MAPTAWRYPVITLMRLRPSSATNSPFLVAAAQRVVRRVDARIGDLGEPVRNGGTLARGQETLLLGFRSAASTACPAASLTFSSPASS